MRPLEINAIMMIKILDDNVLFGLIDRKDKNEAVVDMHSL